MKGWLDRFSDTAFSFIQGYFSQFYGHCCCLNYNLDILEPARIPLYSRFRFIRVVSSANLDYDAMSGQTKL